jgi:hypothetical protein
MLLVSNIPVLLSQYQLKVAPVWMKRIKAKRTSTHSAWRQIKMRKKTRLGKYRAEAGTGFGRKEEE